MSRRVWLGVTDCPAAITTRSSRLGSTTDVVAATAAGYTRIGPSIARTSYANNAWSPCCTVNPAVATANPAALATVKATLSPATNGSGDLVMSAVSNGAWRVTHSVGSNFASSTWLDDAGTTRCPGSTTGAPAAGPSSGGTGVPNNKPGNGASNGDQRATCVVPATAPRHTANTPRALATPASTASPSTCAGPSAASAIACCVSAPTLDWKPSRLRPAVPVPTATATRRLSTRRIAAGVTSGSAAVRSTRQSAFSGVPENVSA